MSMKHVKDIVSDEYTTWKTDNQSCLISIYENHQKLTSQWIENCSSSDVNNYSNREVDSVHYSGNSIDIFLK